jgi:tetratricopeptide (TPR) repeat protein
MLAIQTYRLHRLRQDPTLLATNTSSRERSAAAQYPGTGLAGDDGSLEKLIDEPLLDEDPDGVDAYVIAIEARDRGRDEESRGNGDTAPVAGTPPARSAASRQGAGAGPPKAAAPTGTDADNADRSSRKPKREVRRLLTRAQDAIQRGEYANAIDLLTECLAADPTRQDVYRQLAKVYHTLGMSAEEGNLYNDWMANRPTDALPHYQQASLYLSLGMNSEAVQQLQQFQDLTSGNLNAYPMAASLYRRLGMPDQEAATLQNWVSAAPNSVDARRTLAQFYGRIGDKPDAVAEYETIAQLIPGNAGAHRDLAGAYQQARQYDAAMNELVTAMNLQPQDMGTRMQLAQVYRQMGDMAAALQTYTGIIADAPNSPQASQAQRAATQIQRRLLSPPPTKPGKPKGP